MKYVELNLFPEEEEEIQKDSDSNGSKKNGSSDISSDTTVMQCI